MNGRRTERVGDQIREVLSRLLREEVRDPRIGFVTLTSVEVSSDLRYATVYLTALGGGVDETLAALAGAAPFLQRELGRQVRLRYTPQLRFEEDPSLATGLRVESLLRDAGVEPAENTDEADADK